MDGARRKRLERLIREEGRRAAEALTSGKSKPGPHLERIEAAQKILAAERSSWRPDSWIAIAVAALTTLLVGLLLFLRVHDTPIHFEGRAEAVVLHLSEGLTWSAAPDERLPLRSLDGVSGLWPPSAGRIDDAGCGISLANPAASDVRLAQLAVPAGASLSLWAAPAGGLEMRSEAPLDVRFSGEDAAAAVDWKSAAGETLTLGVADEFVRAVSACGGSTLVLGGGVLALDELAAGQITFLRRGAEDLQVGGYVSSLLSGKLTFYDAGAEAESLLARELVWLDRPTGRVTLRGYGENLLVTFEGRVHEVLRGSGRRSMNPSRLAYLRQNDQMLLAGWALVAVWGFLWSTRQLLLH